MKLARLRHAKGALLLAVLLVFGGALAIVAITATAATAAVNHGQLVPDLARRDVPVVLDGEVRAHALPRRARPAHLAAPNLARVAHDSPPLLQR